jgi:hypothetical protein
VTGRSKIVGELKLRVEARLEFRAAKAGSEGWWSGVGGCWLLGVAILSEGDKVSKDEGSEGSHTCGCLEL